MIKEIIVIKSEYQKLKTDNETMKKALTELINAEDNLFFNIDGRGDLDSALDNAREALAAIGGDDE
ncbi:hypothetical protein EFK22_09335 [Lactococcus lactis subsp. lactis]|uniref:hypothetical protein n=1 Tax=Lactococcus lactis TaxID=1358 RepID=UPI001F0D1B80|nr:hypothetical protein [Lactococcus lactis]MCH5425492.1 hypothetical protein [Lactococcus lactis]MCT0030318.1 hypothetical protein [Lactococcus lactis subsp. lactis]MCT0059105.1 hypothetical protein [Lactococcus lactis subsp. lactis]MCT3090988.1 hypothetical protein [Lactococcus lactis]